MDYIMSMQFFLISGHYANLIPLLEQTHLIIFTFITKEDYNLFFSNISLFLMSLALDITSNALFFCDDFMHKLYEDYGEFDFYIIFHKQYTVFLFQAYLLLYLNF